MKNIIKEAFKVTFPVFIGYMSIGFAFGLMMQGIGLNFIWAGGMSLTVFAGTLEYLAVAFFQGGTSLLSVALMSFLVNFRHIVYGLSLIEEYREFGFFKRLYMIFGLTDETYAILTSAQLPESVKDQKENYFFFVTLMDQSYWVLGSILGATVGSIINLNIQGVDFAMIALFAVLVVEQWKTIKSKLPIFIGVGCGLISLIIMGSGNMIIPALVSIVILLLLFRNKIEGEETDE